MEVLFRVSSFLYHRIRILISIILLYSISTIVSQDLIPLGVSACAAASVLTIDLARTVRGPMSGKRIPRGRHKCSGISARPLSNRLYILRALYPTAISLSL